MPGHMRVIDILGDYRHRGALKFGLTFLFLLELFILLCAFAHEGGGSRIYISEPGGRVVYETRGPVLTSYEKQQFENTFGPLNGYLINEKMVEASFPFRGWLVAAVGIPLASALLLSLLIKIYISLLYGDQKATGEATAFHAEETNRFGSILGLIQHSSIFFIGFVVLVLVGLLWFIPSSLSSLAKSGVAALLQFKWFFIAISVFLAGLISWIVFLRYKLSRKMLDNQLELQKFQMEKEIELQIAERATLESTAQPPLIDIKHDPGERGTDFPN